MRKPYMLYFKKIKMTLNYKNEKTLYVIFFYMIVFAYMLYFELFKNDFKLQKKCKFSLSI